MRRDFGTEPREATSRVPDERVAATERVGAGKPLEVAMVPLQAVIQVLREAVLGGRENRPNGGRTAPRPVSDDASWRSKAYEEKGMIRKKHIRSGSWGTIESFWNAKGTAFFRAPAGARIKVRYGAGVLGFNSQEQTLNGSDYKKLAVGSGSVARARMQVRVSQSTDVTYDVYGGGVAVNTPEIRF